MAGLAFAAPAAASGGGGLYEPFPQPAPSEQVRSFVSHLPGGGRTLEPELTDQELKDGAFPSSGLAATTRPGAASARAAVDSRPAFLEDWGAALGVLVIVLGAGAIAVRRAA